MDTKRVPAGTFGQWLKRKMDARDWNGADLARAIERAGGKARPSDISRWVRGQRRPRPDTLEFVADALNVTHEEAMEAAGHLPRSHMTHLEQWHAVVDPLLQKLPFEPETVFDVRADIEHIVRVREMKRGKRSSETFWDPVEVDTDEEE